MYESGRHLVGPDTEFKPFPADAHFETFDRVTVFTADKLQVRAWLLHVTGLSQKVLLYALYVYCMTFGETDCPDTLVFPTSPPCSRIWWYNALFQTTEWFMHQRLGTSLPSHRQNLGLTCRIPFPKLVPRKVVLHTYMPTCRPLL